MIDLLRRARPAILAYAFGRFAVLLAAQAVTWVHRDATVSQLLGSWDGGWYLAIAETGYPGEVVAEPGTIGNRWAFFPALPAAAKVLSSVGISPSTAAIAFSTLAGLVAVVAIWVLVEERFGDDTATATASFVALFPAAYVLGMVYTESAFLACSALCLLAVRHRWWVAAGVLASAGTLVRSSGLVLVATVGLVALVAIRRDRTWRPVLGMVTAPLGFVAWTIYQATAADDPLASFAAQDLWGNSFVWFRTPFESLWEVLTTQRAWSDAQDVMAAGAVLLLAVAAVLAVRYARANPGVIPLEWWIYSAGTALLALSPYWPSSVLRYTLVVFPLFAPAVHLTPAWLRSPLLATSAAVMTTLAFAAFLGSLDFQAAPFAP